MTEHSKIIFVNAQGDYEETAFADTLKYTSFKTANYELTDALLGDVTNLMIKSDGSRAFAADQSFGGFKATNVANGTATNDAVNFGQLSAAINGFDWKASARAATTAALPAATYANGASGVGATLTANANGALAAQDGVTLIVGDRILVKDQAAGLQNGIYTVTAVGDGSNPFVLTRAVDADTAAELNAGATVTVEEGTAQGDRIYQLQTNNAIVIGTTALVFVKIVVSYLVGGAGITMTGETIAADLATGGGIKFVGVGDAGQLAVEPNDFAGEGLVDDGSDNLAIDWATSPWNMSKAVKASDLSSTSNGKGASIIGLEDAGGYTTQTNVEGAIQELYAQSGGYLYTVGAGNVEAGDLVYVSANNTVRKFTTITTGSRVIGVATETKTAGQSVKVQRADYVVPGCLVGATAGTEYFWDGTDLTTTMPSGGGSYVWKAGVAVNATDLDADVELVKKNS